MKNQKDKRASTMLTTFGGGEDEAQDKGYDPAAIADRVDVKLMIPRTMRDQLDLVAARKYGRGKMRTMLIETVLREYLKTAAWEEEEPKEEGGRPWGS